MSFIPYDVDCPFPIQNLPFDFVIGIFRPKDGTDTSPRAGVAIGKYALDLHALAKAGVFEHSEFDYSECFNQVYLNAFMKHPRPSWVHVRQRLQTVLGKEDPTMNDDEDLKKSALFPLEKVEMLLPVNIGDYTDFYSSREHATNVGTMFRGAENALQPNWLHLPVGYHGRASSVVVSGTPIRRPCGQLQKDPANPKAGSVYGACKLLDFELEMGVFVGGPGNELGSPVDITDVENHIFGFVVMNDWSARDIQKWEYVPLGPFGAKNFGTTISPWIVTPDALEPFKASTSAEVQSDPLPLPYLQEPGYSSYDIKLEVSIESTETGGPSVITKSNFRNMYWTHRQQLVHHTVTGCNLRAGDLLGSGTISGKTEDSYGSMLELSWKGSKTVSLGNGVERKFLKDGDTVNLRGECQGAGFRIGFGDCSGLILQAESKYL